MSSKKRKRTSHGKPGKNMPRTRERVVPRLSRDRARARQKAFETLREAFLLGRFGPGDIVTVRTLTETFRLSTLPVREATARLIGEGALQRERNGRLRLPNVTLDEYRDLMDIRLLLEPLAAAEAARRCELAQSDKLVAALESLVKAMRGTDTSAMLTANARLHFAVYRAAQRPQLLHVIEGLWLRSGPLLTAVFAPRANFGSDLQPGVAAHERLIEQVIVKNPDASQDAMAQILQFTRQQFLLRYRFPG